MSRALAACAVAEPGGEAARFFERIVYDTSRSIGAKKVGVKYHTFDYVHILRC